MSYEWMKFHFSNFIHQLPLVKMLDDKVQDIFRKLLEASTRWYILFRLKIDIDVEQIMRWCILASGQRRTI